MKIIGFSGKKQSGKTTVSEFLLSEISSALSRSFAFYLKEVVAACFDDTIVRYGKTYDTDEGKSDVLPCHKTVREVLQIVGTDMFRSLDSKCWIRPFEKWCRNVSDCSLIVVPDVRFPNEVRCIRDLGGVVIRLLRAPFGDVDKHESETALDEMEVIGRGTRKEIILEDSPIYSTVWIPRCGFDAIIDNRKMTIEQQNEAVWKLVNEKGWI